MARDGNGNYNLPQAAFQPNTTISSAAVNHNFSDIAAALSGSLAKDGQTAPTGNLAMGGYAHTGVGNGSARNQYAAIGQVQDQAFSWCGTAGGTANAVTLSPSPPITAYADGQRFSFRAQSDNTAQVTIAVSGLSAKDVTFGTGVVGGEFTAGAVYDVVFDGTDFVVKGAGAAIPPGVILDWALPTAPSGWALCDGAALATETPGGLRQALLDAGSPYGVNGSGHPLLPDLRGRVTTGRDDMGGSAAGRITGAGSGISGTTLGASGGAETVTLTTAQIPSHRHTVGTTPISAARDSAGTPGATQGADNTGFFGGGDPHGNMPPLLVINKIIKL
jgi:microcystin-dependent protein